MTQFIDAEALLGDARRKQKRAKDVAARARAKLGVETASTRSKSLTRAEARERDARSLKRLARVFRRYPRLNPAATGRSTTVTLASGRRLTWDPEAEKWVNSR